MRIVINTPSGNIGRVVVEQLLAARHDLVLITRHPQKVAAAAAKGARVVCGSLDDEAVLHRAFEGAEALFWVTPISFEPSDYMTWARQLAERAATIARTHSIARAVVVSSIGAQHEMGIGPIGCNAAIERAFENAIPDVTVLRPASFMENLLQHVGTIAQSGVMYTRYPISRKIPWIATRDIAARAVTALTDERTKGHRVVELQGPVDLDPNEVASIVAEAIGRPVHSIEVDDDQARRGMIAAGVPSAFAELLLEMYAAVASGRMQRTQARDATTTTPTSLHTFARDVLKPAVDAARAH